MGIESQSPLKSPKNSQESKIQKSARVQFGSFFDEYNNPQERISAIFKRIEPFFQGIDKEILPEEKINEIKTALSACENISDKQQFLDEVIRALKPAFDVRETHINEFEEAQAHAMDESGNFTKINRLVSYGKSGPTIHIHARAGEAVDNKITLYRDGMKKLAEIVKEDDEISKITASSTLVTTHTSLFTRTGFKIEDISEEFRLEHFADEKGEVKIATISREDFLKRFLKEK